MAKMLDCPIHRRKCDEWKCFQKQTCKDAAAQPLARRSPFTRPERGMLRATIDGITYTATYFPSGGPGTRAYWTVQTSDRDPEYYRDGNDWYESSERNVRAAILAVAEKRRIHATT